MCCRRRSGVRAFTNSALTGMADLNSPQRPSCQERGLPCNEVDVSCTSFFSKGDTAILWAVPAGWCLPRGFDPQSCLPSRAVNNVVPRVRIIFEISILPDTALWGLRRRMYTEHRLCCGPVDIIWSATVVNNAPLWHR